jgi:uncharacterized protein YbjT (DUF2867 family)
MFAILGASGKVGRVTVQRLLAQGAPVRAVVRKSSNKADLEATGLVRELYVAHNAGRIDVEPGGEVCFGTTGLREALRPLCG